ncbi:snRNA-activating protein complex subunit 2 [Pelodytes ibericus]
MKPPLRRRSAPVRYETIGSGPVVRVGPIRLTWTAKEKLQLLKGLKAERDKKIPEPTVNRRSKAEVSSYISWLRGRTAREAVQTEYERWVQEKKTQDSKIPAPIELWTDISCRMSDSTEEAITAAFSQMLTIAATEPVGFCHSETTKLTKAISQKANPESIEEASSSGTQSKEKGSMAEEPVKRSEPATSQGRDDDRWKKLSFGKIYTYLSKTARGEELPKLTEEESLLVLHLLYSLPDQLQSLDCNSIGSYLRQKYSSLNSRRDLKESTNQETDPPPTSPSWKDLGFCPLNPFLIPLDLLRTKKEN